MNGFHMPALVSSALAGDFMSMIQLGLIIGVVLILIWFAKGGRL